MATMPDGAKMPDKDNLLARRPTVMRRLAVGVLAFAAAAQMFSSQMSTVALLAQKPQFADGLLNARSRPAALRAWQMALTGASRDRVLAAANLANQGSPLNEPAFAAAALTLGPDAAGSAWLDHAWSLSRRDPWLLQAMFARARAHGDAAGELAAIAALLQLQLPPGDMRETLLADMQRPAAFDQTVQVLRSKPRWRHRLFDGLRIEPSQAATVTALIVALRNGDAALAPEDMTVLLAPLVYGRNADPAVADTVWRAWLGTADPWAWPLSAGTGVHLPFDWTLGDHAQSEDAKLVFAGKDNATEPVATKVIYLPAGQYRFVANAGPGLNDAGISASLDCNGQHIALANGAIWRTDGACRNAELRLMANSAEGSIVRAALMPG